MIKRWQIILLGLLGTVAIALSTKTGKRAFMAVYQTLSNFGLNLIRRFEGFRPNVYQDAAGHWTIGYGHLIKPGESYYPYGNIKTITHEEAVRLLEQDTATAQNAVREYVKVPLTQNQFDALTSFVFNVGVGAFRNSILLRKLNSGDYSGAAKEFEKWKYAKGIELPGLIARRTEEKRIFLT